jgi:serine/threonine protein kinase
VFCPQCRTELPDDATYCYECGYDVTRLKTPQWTTAPGTTPPWTTPPRDPFSTLWRAGDSDDDAGYGPAQIRREADILFLPVGTLVAGRYEILSEGKAGGFGIVYEVKDTVLEGIKALKCIHTHLLEKEPLRRRFHKEVKIGQDLLHDHIVRIYDFNTDRGMEFFTMEWIDGCSLRDLINERKKAANPFTPEEVLPLLNQLCAALSYAHGRKVVHRDIKPENILIVRTSQSSVISDGSSAIGRQSETMAVKLTDFGLATVLHPSGTVSSLFGGTPSYMAPEQRDDPDHVDHRIDVYATGVVLFELLTLKSPTGLEPPSELNPSLPPEIDPLIKKALSNKPELRYQSIEELATAFSEVAALDQRREEEQKRAEEESQRELLERQEQENLRKEEEARQKKAEEERLRREAEEQKRREAEDRKRKEEEARLRKEAEDRQKAEEERLRKEAEDRQKKEEEARLKREAEERRKKEEERLRKEAEEQKRREAEERKRQEKGEQKGRRNPVPIIILVVVALCVVGIGAYFALRGPTAPPVETVKKPVAEPVAPKTPAEPKPTVPAQVASKGSLNITATPWARVYIGDKDYGQTPQKIDDLDFGTYTVRLEHPDSGKWEKKVTISKKETVQIHHKFGGVGTLMINASPWARIYLDEKLIGQTPLSVPNVPSGVRKIRVVKEGYTEIQETVPLKPGETKHLSYSPQKKVD